MTVVITPGRRAVTIRLIKRNKEIITFKLFNIAFKHQFAMFTLLRLSHCFPELRYIVVHCALKFWEYNMQGSH